MNWGPFGWAVLGLLVLLFWAVGAHNRLRALRNQVLAAWPAVDAALQARAHLLADVLAALATQAAAAEHAALRESVQAALAQVRASADQARGQAAQGQAILTLAAAEAALAAPLARLQALAGVDHAALDEAARRLAFARQPFNAAVASYNEAVHEFPTLLLAPLLRLGPAGAL